MRGSWPEMEGIMRTEKTCPKCASSPVMQVQDTYSIVPKYVNQDYGTPNPVSVTSGTPVTIYECPTCGLVEMYHGEF